VRRHARNRETSGVRRETCGGSLCRSYSLLTTHADASRLTPDA